jgi:hypothetical protein
MDPISVALLAALAGGVAGEVGRQSWTALSALVRRPFRGGDGAAGLPAVSSGEAELAALGQAPADEARAQTLSTALAVRAAVDPDFRAALQQWHAQAKRTGSGGGDVNSTILGGTYSGPVIAGRDFTGITFTTHPQPPAAAPTDGETTTRD